MDVELYTGLLHIGGVVHLCVLIASASAPRVLHWRAQVERVTPIVGQLLWVYGAYIFGFIVSFAALSLTMAAHLADGSPLARVVCGFIALFWLVRLVVQWVVLDLGAVLTTRLLRTGSAVLTAAFAYLGISYAAVALCTG